MRWEHRSGRVKAAVSAAVAVITVVTLALGGSGCDELDVRFDPDAGLVIGPARSDAGAVGPGGAGGDAGGAGSGGAPGAVPPVGLTACQRELVQRGVNFSIASQPMASPPGRTDIVCMVEDPVSLRPQIRGVTYHPARVTATPTAMFMSCALALSVDRMTQVLADRGVTDVAYLGIYGCRVVAGTSTLSEHGRGRAIDVGAFKLGSGVTYVVLSDWEKNQPAPVTMAGSFLRQTVTALHDQRIFTILLTPDYNADHANHFHLDITPDADLFK